MDCSCEVRNERSYRFRRTRWRTHARKISNAGAGDSPLAGYPTPTTRHSKAAAHRSPLQNVPLDRRLKNATPSGNQFRKAARGDPRRRLEDKPPHLALGTRMPSAGRAGCPQPAAVGAHDIRSRNSPLNGNEFCEPLSSNAHDAQRSGGEGSPRSLTPPHRPPLPHIRWRSHPSL
jgi:hypothetical protein